LDSFKTNGKFPAKAYLGVEYQMLSKQVALLNQVPEGAYVVNVVTGSPAEKAGVAAGDVIFKVDGNSISADNGGLAKAIAAKKVGDSLKLSIWRDGDQKEVTVALSESSN